jgi:hypothetical protein
MLDGDFGVVGTSVLAAMAGLDRVIAQLRGRKSAIQICLREADIPIPRMHADHLGGRITEHVREALVHLQHGLAVVEDADSIQRILQQGVMPGGRTPRGLESLHFLGDIAELPKHVTPAVKMNEVARDSMRDLARLGHQVRRLVADSSGTLELGHAGNALFDARPDAQVIGGLADGLIARNAHRAYPCLIDIDDAAR